MSKLNTWILRKYAALKDEEGQGLAEYGLILALVSVVAAGVLLTLGGDIKSTLSAVSTALTSAAA